MADNMIKNFELYAVDAKRYTKTGEKVGQVRIDLNNTITSIAPVDSSNSRIEFRFSVRYGAIGHITIEGRLVYSSSDAEDLWKMWAEKSQMPDKAAEEIHTAIMGNCLPSAFQISREIRLPPPVPIPKVNIAKKDDTHRFTADGMYS